MSDCGCVPESNSGDDCDDCAGVPNGTNWVSDCGCVPESNSGDDCDDCTGVPNGTNWMSDCGCVPASNSGDDCDDCAGVPNGNSYVDNCGTCDNDPSNDCVQDCTGIWGGTATIDECGECDGPGIPEGDCDCDGNVPDAIDVCGGDCPNDYNGNGICDTEDVYGCTYLDASNYNYEATSDDGSCIYDECDPNAGYDTGYSDGVESVDITSDNQDAYDQGYASGVASVECPDGDNSCPGDLNDDGSVSTSDLLIFLSHYDSVCE
jgi:hypothetical protein